MKVLWQLMQEREPHVNISHRGMPTWEQHVNFVSSRPYKNWWIIQTDEGECAGACYLSKQNEIGVFVLKAYSGRSIGLSAICEIMVLHPGERLLANINPRNESSIALFERLGFRHCQSTYELVS